MVSLIVILGFYAILVAIFIVLYKRIQRRWLCHSILAVSIVLYASSYIPSIIDYRKFATWKSDHPEFQAFEQLTPGSVKGVYLPHWSCGSICKELLINGRVEFVETKAGDYLKSVSGERILSGVPYARWKLARSNKTCWSISEGLLSDVNVFQDKSYLAQGVCFIPEAAQERKAELWIFQSQDQKASTGNQNLIEETRSYTGKIRSRNNARIAFTANYKLISVLAFPLLPYMRGYWGLTDPGFMRRKLVHGSRTLGEALDRFGALSRPIKSSRSGYLLQETGRDQIYAALNSTNPVIRWSAGYALCLLDEKFPGSVDNAINQLKRDPIPAVAATAQKAVRGHKKRCQYYSPYPRKVWILEDGTRILQD